MLEDLRGDRLELKMHADVSFNNGNLRTFLPESVIGKQERIWESQI